MHEQSCTCRESRTRFPVSRASPWRIQASLVYRQTFDRLYFPIEGGCSAKGYDREKRGGLTGGMKGSKEGRRRRRRKEGRRSKRSAESGGTRGIIRPSTPQAHPLPPLFSYPLHSSSRYSTRPLKALFVPPAILRPSPFSPFSSPLSFLRPCFSHFVTLYFTPYLDFMRTAKWGYLLR